jgi:hypothetical protein
VEPKVDAWIGADPKTADWNRDTARKARETAKNKSQLLYLYWQNDSRFRAFKDPSQWLQEVEEPQWSAHIGARRAWGKELQNFFDYWGKTGKPLSSRSQSNIRAAVLHFFKYQLATSKNPSSLRLE